MDLLKEQKISNAEKSDLMRTEFSVLEFDWIFRGDMAIKFIKRLSNYENDELFANETIRIIIMFLW